MKMIFLFFLAASVMATFSCNSFSKLKYAPYKEGKKISYCQVIDSLIAEHYNSKGTGFLIFNNDTAHFAIWQEFYIPILEKRTMIKAHYDIAGFSGIGYHLDSVFNSDIKSWAQKLGCTNYKLPIPRNRADTVIFYLNK